MQAKRCIVTFENLLNLCSVFNYFLRRIKVGISAELITFYLIYCCFIQSCLYLHARARSDSGLSVGLPGSEDHRQHELANLTNLHTLQSLTTNPAMKYYQNQQYQVCHTAAGLATCSAPNERACSAVHRQTQHTRAVQYCMWQGALLGGHMLIGSRGVHWPFIVGWDRLSELCEKQLSSCFSASLLWDHLCRRRWPRQTSHGAPGRCPTPSPTPCQVLSRARLSSCQAPCGGLPRALPRLQGVVLAAG